MLTIALLAKYREREREGGRLSEAFRATRTSSCCCTVRVLVILRVAACLLATLFQFHLWLPFGVSLSN